jgi:hypothetical protein
MRFDGSNNKLYSFISNFCLKLAGDSSCLPKPQHQLYYTFRQLAGQALTEVKAYIMDDGINLADMLT